MSREGLLAKSAREKMIVEAKKKKMETKARKVLVIRMDKVSPTQKAQKV